MDFYRISDVCSTTWCTTTSVGHTPLALSLLCTKRAENTLFWAYLWETVSGINPSEAQHFGSSTLIRLTRRHWFLIIGQGINRCCDIIDSFPVNTMGDASLDIHNLTDRVMVMGNFYENDKLNEVRTYYTTMFSNHHTIYNVSSEPEFNIEQDLDNVRNYPFNANNPCALKAIIAFCVDAEAYLNANTRNVIAIHCRTGSPLNIVVVVLEMGHHDFIRSTLYVIFQVLGVAV